MTVFLLIALLYRCGRTSPRDVHLIFISRNTTRNYHDILDSIRNVRKSFIGTFSRVGNGATGSPLLCSDSTSPRPTNSQRLAGLGRRPERFYGRFFVAAATKTREMPGLYQMRRKRKVRRIAHHFTAQQNMARHVLATTEGIYFVS